MCQRYVLPDQVVAEREFVPGKAWWNFTARFNVSARQYVPAVRLHDGQSEGVMLRWGLIPSWAETLPAGPPKTAVHVSRIERSRNCQAAWVNRQRCILPMTGFYAWQLTADQYRQPFFVRLERGVFGVAALWDRWVDEGEDVIESAALVCVPANQLLSEIAGAHRGMPAILRRKDYAAWLGGSPAEAQAALRSYRGDWMRAYPVSPRVNSVAADDPALIRAAG